jgi:hypothetical protein
MLDIEVGWTFLAAGWVPIRIALGFAGTLGAASSISFVGPNGTTIQPRSAVVQMYLLEATQYLDNEYRSYVFTGVISVGVGFRPY